MLSAAIGIYETGTIILSINIMGDSISNNCEQAVSILLEHVNIQPQEISLVAISGGPGSFTGLRAGFSFAYGICTGLKIPLIVVPSDYAMCYPYRKLANYCIAIIPVKENNFLYSVFNSKMKKIKTPSSSISIVEFVSRIKRRDASTVVSPSSFKDGYPFKRKKYEVCIVGNIGGLKGIPLHFRVRFMKKLLEASDIIRVARFFPSTQPEQLATLEPYYCKPPYVT